MYYISHSFPVRFVSGSQPPDFYAGSAESISPDSRGIPVDAKATYARQRRGITRPGDVGLGLRLETSDYTNYDKHLSIIGHGAAINAGSELESGPEFQLPNDCDY